ncbi:hypothetical protein SLEP1_g27013 [Rubroshorea leprosula]|uniref:Isopropylmalate dehydrogenase-like domain-containing protein n=1 Tax=Rubroshorea leprosula TaxID=152421 RepID=A0AAV5K1J2_9ROSI|nr:hypothetical protein SLEP1_g27013 [Rubroshorea leprosula]
MAFSAASTPIRATLFPGDGIGPEIAESVKTVLLFAFFFNSLFSLVILLHRMLDWSLMLRGDGIGPEIAESVKTIFRAAEVPIEWEEHYVGDQVDPRTQSFLTWESLESVRRNKVGLKGPMATPIGKGHRSLNLTLRKELNLYANVRPCYSLPDYKTRYDDVNLITIRENTEGEYSGLEHQVVRGVVESLKIITCQASL